MTMGDCGNMSDDRLGGFDGMEVMLLVVVVVNEDDFDGRMVTGASRGGGLSSLCFSFQCLFRLFLHLYKFPHNEQANFTRRRRKRRGMRLMSDERTN